MTGGSGNEPQSCIRSDASGHRSNEFAGGVNGQFDVPAGGQVKVPTLCGMF